MQPAKLVKADIARLAEPGPLTCQDYLEAAFVGIKVLLVYALINLALLLIFAPLMAGVPIWNLRVMALMINIICSPMALILILEFPAILAVSDAIYRFRLKKYGRDAFMREHKLPMTQAEAFELCLAAASQLPKSSLACADEEQGLIVARVKQNPLLRPDRDVYIALSETVAGDQVETTVKVSTGPYHTKSGSIFMVSLLGNTFSKVPRPGMFNINRRMLDTISNYINSVPNWDHKHISVSEDEHWKSLLQLQEGAEE